MLPASAVTHLVDRNGGFRTDMAALGAAIFIQPAVRGASSPQKSRRSSKPFAPTGLPLDHCNAHKHFHLHPVIGRLMATIGGRFGLRAARVPLEPARLLRAIEPQTSRRPAPLTTPFALCCAAASAPRASRTRPRVRASMVRSNDGEAGFRSRRDICLTA